MENRRIIIQEEVRNENGELQYIKIPNYRRKQEFLNNAEYKFYLTLKKIYKDNENIEIFVQVALNRILEFNNERAKKEFGYYKINERSIDFVVYNTKKDNIGILYCIELNGSEHYENETTKERDRILKNIFDIANINLKFINIKEIKKIIVNGKEWFEEDSIKNLLNLNKEKV